MTIRHLTTFLLCLSACLSVWSSTYDITQKALFENDDPKLVDHIGGDKKRGERWLRDAVWQKKYNIAEALLNKGVNVNCKTDIRRTPLHGAVGDAKMAELLLKRGANVNAEAEYDVHARRWVKLTPLHFAAMRGCLDTTQVLLKYGAKINAKDYQNKSALHMAVEKKIWT